MLQKKPKTNPLAEDMALLAQSMDKVIEGDFSLIDVTTFHNSALAEKYNQMLTSILEINNGFVMKMNKAMSRIANGAVVKDMLEEVTSQSASIKGLRASSQELGDSIQNIQSAAQSIQDSSHGLATTSNTCSDSMNASIQIVDESSVQINEINKQIITFKENAEKINEIIDTVRSLAEESSLLALNASIEAARAGESGRGFGVVAQQMSQLSSNTTSCADNVTQYVLDLTNGISSISDTINDTTKKLQDGNESVHNSVQSLQMMNKQLGSIRNEIDSIYEEINSQSALTKSFVNSVESIAESYHTLYQECMDTGVHMYHISRDVDNARNDMAKNNSKLSRLDWLTVFEIDHLTLTWRLYNNIVEFEHLKITQLNNPDGCKFGKWIGQQTDPRITDSSAFKQAIQAHKDIHKHACDSWYAKEDGNRESAMRSFEQALDAFNRFSATLDDLREVIRRTGDTDEASIPVNK